MKRAIVLMKVEPTKEEKALEELSKKDFVLEAYIVFGDYDLVAVVSYEEESKLHNLLLKEIGAIEGVLKTTTLIVAKEYTK